jgi:hypothetical protein
LKGVVGMNFKSLDVLHDATKATGTGRPLEVAAFSCAALVVTGTFVATITWQGTADGSNWVDLLAYNPSTGNWSTTAIAPGTYVIPTVGLQDVRASVAWTSGTSVTIKGMVSEVPVPLPNLFTEVAINGRKAAIRVPCVVGTKTVTTTAASIFAGVSALVSRYYMIVTNVGGNTVYHGPAGVLTTTGTPLQPGDSMVFEFDPAVATDEYFIAAANTEVRVEERAVA